MTTAADARADTFPKLLTRNARLRPNRTAFRHKDLGIWQSWTWGEVHDIVRAYACGLQSLGLTVGILDADREERKRPGLFTLPYRSSSGLPFIRRGSVSDQKDPRSIV